VSPAASIELQGAHGRLAVHTWPAPAPRFLVLLAHGYGEHAGRYEHVAARLVEEGAAVYAPDHLGHGHSEGDRVHMERVDDLVADLHTVADRARADHPELPLVALGHSMGGLLAARYAQLHGDELAALVLSGPLVGGNPALLGLLDLDPIPEIPIDPAVLSRDPAVGEAYAADPLVWHGAFKRATLEAFVAAVGAIAAGPDLGALPTLWIHGEEDVLVPLSATRPAMEHLRGEHLEEHVYPGARHEVFNEVNRDEVLDDVTAFVTRVLGRGSV
jgi:alpha-beta hydrolase superfamily lysophospholipase